MDISSSGNISFVGAVGDPFSLKWNRGISDMNVPLVWVSNFDYQTPGLKSMNRIVRGILGNFELSSIYYWRSGHPFSLYGGWCNTGGCCLLYTSHCAPILPLSDRKSVV